MTVYAGTAPARMQETLDVITAVVAGLADKGATDQELAVAKGYLEGSMVLGLEDSGSRMGRLGSSMTIRDEVTSIEEHVERIRAVTSADVLDVAGRLLHERPTLAAVGPITAADLPAPS